jgi:hypothetical protein
MVRTMRVIFLFFIVNLLLLGCIAKNDKKDRFNFEKILDNILVDVNYTKEVSFNKNELDVSTIFVKVEDDKNKFKEKFERLVNKEKFIKVESLFVDQDVYCYDKKNEIKITLPKKQLYKNENGNTMEIDKENLDKVIITYRYNMYGTTSCDK